ncbi:hydroxymethylbilane synthase [Zavarzinella formosa]|uniref:hydroxymethylbilane synthase n=1 Tax=Zavarzinella formosa TaxID=360055 RepID=UPI0002DB19ED|nr:hydroxymethylbilane synthase [Zavarzinella formosa]
MNPLRLGTRGSQLALWQANHVAALLRPLIVPQEVELVIIDTIGDQVLDRPLSAMGGFGVFTKAIQEALLDGRADIAVHSLKDLPTFPVAGLMLGGVPARGPTGDAFVSAKHKRFEDLPQGAVIGTSSLRRRAMLLHQRPDLKIVDLRGNVETRLRKLTDQNLDAIVLAEAGLVRLGLGSRITHLLDNSWMMPAVGQGAIGLECREDDHETRDVLESLTHRPTMTSVLAERAMLYALGGGCLVPIGGIVTLEQSEITLKAGVYSQDGVRRITESLRGPMDKPLNVGAELAARLLSAGAREMLL